MTKVDPELYALRPWYHDFSSLGFDTAFLGVPLTLEERLQRVQDLMRSVVGRVSRRGRIYPGHARSFGDVLRRSRSSHLLNQPVKERHLMQLVDRALATAGPRPNCLELFSADGYYSCRIKTLAPRARISGVDLDPAEIRRAETISRRLALDDVTFRVGDARTFAEQADETYDLVLCAGGLYHLSDPARLLQALKRAVRGHLVLQSVVTLETEDPGYLEQPAKGRPHGCRFTHAWLRAQLERLGWHIVDQARAELPGNRHLRDRGSSFFLCRPVRDEARHPP